MTTQRRRQAAKDVEVKSEDSQVDQPQSEGGDEPRSLPADTVTLVNPGSSGVVYDLEGHSLGGGERVTVPYPLNRVAQKQVNKGYLLVDTWTPGAEAPNADDAEEGRQSEESRDAEQGPAEAESKTDADGGESDQSTSDQVG